MSRIFSVPPHTLSGSPVKLCGWEIKVGMVHSICGLNVRVAGKSVLSLITTCPT